MKPRAVVLPVGTEEHRRHLLLHLAVLGVLHQPDDLDVELDVVADAVADELADGVAPEVELAREGLVDDGDLAAAQLSRPA